MPNPANPQSYNRYSYVRNNPLKFVDPTGHVACGLLGEGDAAGCEKGKDNGDGEGNPPLPPPTSDNIPNKCESLLEGCYAGEPIAGFYYSATTGYEFNAQRGNKLHTGVDFGPAPDHDALAVLNNGVVVLVDNIPNGEGVVVIIEYTYDVLPIWLIEELGLLEGQSIFIQYQHLKSAKVNVGQVVNTLVFPKQEVDITSNKALFCRNQVSANRIAS